MLYHAHEITHAALAPWKKLSQVGRVIYSSPLNPLSYTPFGKSMAAACEVFDRITKQYDKPDWDIADTDVGGKTVSITIDTRLCTPFCDLIHFRKENSAAKRAVKTKTPKVLMIAPLSGHYATLLRGTVRAMLPEHDVYMTDWHDARDIPLSRGTFTLDDHIDTLMDFIRFLGPDVHVVAVCQPTASLLAAVSLMAADNDPDQPRSMVLMGGPIDTRINPTEVNKHAEGKPLSWFEHTVISRVPFPLSGAMRKVYPGFVQLTGFMTMNLDRHIESHMDLYNHLVDGDGDSADQHRDFYDEYLAVMDLPAEFYLQTIETIFKEHSLPRGKMYHRGVLVEPAKIKKTALMTVEGEKDDICGVGQTGAAHGLCSGLNDERKVMYVQKDVGHYGVFNGRRWKTEIQPRIAAFIRDNS